ncbi:MAG: hypothetical protein WDO14_08275 [Bacteroidota bacterium]
MRSWLYSVLVGLTLLCVSCLDKSEYEIDSVSWNPSVALPLVNGQLHITDILNDDDSIHFKTDSDGLLYVEYDKELQSTDIRKLFSIPSKSVAKSFILPGAVIPPHNNDIRSDSIISAIDFGMSPEKLNEIALNSGNVSFATSLLPQSSQLKYDMYLVLSGFKSRSTGKALNAVINGSGNIDLSDYTLSLTDNKFDLKLVLVFKKSTTSTTIAPATSVNVQLAFGDFKFIYIKGFLGDQVTSLEAQTVDLGIFDGGIFDQAEISLANPVVSINVINGNGVPVSADFVKIEARKQGSDPIKVLMNPANPVDLNFPTVLGDTKSTTVAVTNVKELLDYAPGQIYYQADARINSGLTSGNNFIMDTSQMRVNVHVEVPLWGSASGIVLQDTLDVDLSSAEDSDVETASLKLKLLNQFPLDGNIQFVLTDEHYAPITTLLTEDQSHLIEGSTVDANGELQSVGTYDNIIKLNDDKIENLFKAKHLIMIAALQTSRDGQTGTPPDVKFKADYSLSVEAGILATVKLNVK